MRKIKLLNLDGDPFGHFHVKTNEKETAVNAAFAELESNKGRIVKTEYLPSHSGEVVTVIIEYEANT